MDIATIVKETVKAHDGEFAVYHIRMSNKAKGPQAGGANEVVEVLQRKDSETEEAFYGRVRRFVDALPN